MYVIYKYMMYFIKTFISRASNWQQYASIFVNKFCTDIVVNGKLNKMWACTTFRQTDMYTILTCQNIVRDIPDAIAYLYIIH